VNSVVVLLHSSDSDRREELNCLGSRQGVPSFSLALTPLIFEAGNPRGKGSSFKGMYFALSQIFTQAQQTTDKN
jgi:hypothetical protein